MFYLPGSIFTFSIEAFASDLLNKSILEKNNFLILCIFIKIFLEN